MIKITAAETEWDESCVNYVNCVFYLGFIETKQCKWFYLFRIVIFSRLVSYCQPQLYPLSRAEATVRGLLDTRKLTDRWGWMKNQGTDKTQSITYTCIENKNNNNIFRLCSAERHNAIPTPGWNCSQLPTFPLWVCNKSTDTQLYKKLQLWVQKNNYVTVKPLHNLIYPL